MSVRIRTFFSVICTVLMSSMSLIAFSSSSGELSMSSSSVNSKSSVDSSKSEDYLKNSSSLSSSGNMNESEPSFDSDYLESSSEKPVQKYDNSTSSKSYNNNYSQLNTKSSSTKKSSSTSNNTLLPKTKVDDSKELDTDQLQLDVESNDNSDDFGFIKNSNEGNESIEWIKILGILFIVLACLGFIYSILGLLCYRKSFKNKK